MGHALRRAGVRIVFAEDARSLHHDEVSLGRYKGKLMESARYGLTITQAKSPEYVASTKFVYLLPMDWHADSPTLLVRKFVLSLFCARPISVVLEWWARYTDGAPRLYSGSLYRMLAASWVYQGYRGTGDADRRIEVQRLAPPTTRSGRQMKALVTGGAGFIGSNIVRHLLAEGDQRHRPRQPSSPGHAENLAPFPQVEFVRGDVRDPAAVTAAARDASVIFHLAASVGNKRSIDDPDR